MKRAIVALALVGTLLLSVVTCQIYNPADNSTLYTAMRTEGAISKTDYLKKFEDADADGKYTLLKEFETFRKTFKDKEKWIAAFGSAKEDGDLETPYSSDYRTLSSIYGTKEKIEELWDKEFKVLYDFNGKL
ncbi:MAG: hypothetical protein J1G30_09675 [Spirochaetales bacterium]|nr:hypothetical protein [Spirochaetales bacterium]